MQNLNVFDLESDFFLKIYWEYYNKVSATLLALP